MNLSVSTNFTPGEIYIPLLEYKARIPDSVCSSMNSIFKIGMYSKRTK